MMLQRESSASSIDWCFVYGYFRGRVFWFLLLNGVYKLQLRAIGSHAGAERWELSHHPCGVFECTFFTQGVSPFLLVVNVSLECPALRLY